MNKRPWIICGIALTVLLVWWALHVSKAHPVALLSAGETNQASALPAAQIQTNSATAVSIPPTLTPVSNNLPTWIIDREKQRKADVERVQDEWRTPIEFYGLVVDENTNPVEGADIHFSWTDLSVTGTSERQTTSDAGGLFSLLHTTGKNLIVDVSKEGYYPYQPSGAAFNYAGANQNFIPDVQNPVFFRLRKKGVGEALAHFQSGFDVPKDGTPVLIDLAKGNVTQSSENAIKVECWTHDNEKKEGNKFDWKCRVSVPGGGLQIYDEEFPFLAPENNYVAANEIDMTVRPGVEWTLDVTRNYFVMTGDGKYARMNFRMIAHGDHFCLIDCYFNPSGSRVLEPQ